MKITLEKKKKESRIHKILTKNLPKFRGTRIENSAELGTPDAHWQGQGFSFWAEYKEVILTKNNFNSIKPDWRPGQIGWARDHKKAGGYWFLLILINGNLWITNSPKERYFKEDLKIFYPSEILTSKINVVALLDELQEVKYQLASVRENIRLYSNESHRLPKEVIGTIERGEV